MFRRSDNGLSNQTLFLDVDYVVYVEGVARPAGLGDSFDERFWKTIFARCAPDKRLAFKPGGSKSNLEKIAKSIVSGSIRGTIVCLDTDYENFYRTRHLHRFVLYTYGYSWENDISPHGHLLKMLDLFCFEAPTASEEKKVLNNVKEFEMLGEKIGRSDIILQAEGFPLQNKRKPGELIEFNDKEGTFRFSSAQIRKKSKEIRVKRVKPRMLSVIDYDFWRDYHGKTLYFALYNFLRAFAAVHGGAIKISNEFMLVRLLRWFEHDNEPEKWGYFKEICGKI